MQFFNLSLKLNGYDIQSAKQALKDIQAIPENHYRAYVNDKKSAIVDYHLSHNSFYKSFAQGINSNDWNSIPILTKNHLQQPLSKRLSQDISLRKIYKNKTSGSSGHPFLFAKDKWCHALTWAEIMDRFAWYDIDFNHSKQARFYGIPLDKTGYFKERLKDKLSNRYRFSIFDLSDAALEKVLHKFDSIAFDYINGYTSSIVQFAKFLKRKNIVLRKVCPSLKVCVTTAEMLFSDDKILLEHQFGIPVVNEYGASELGVIAFQNPSNQWRVSSETLYVEILDENDNSLPYGEKGRVVITALYNKAHPFIRYDIGDTGSLCTTSTLKAPVLNILAGRTNDIAILPSGKTAAGLTFYYITKSIIEDDGNVSEFIIEQNTIKEFVIKYVAISALTIAQKQVIINEMETYLEPGIVVVFEKHKTLQRMASGKLKQFISNL